MFGRHVYKEQQKYLLSLNLVSSRMRSGDELSRTIKHLIIGKVDTYRGLSAFV